MATNKSIKIQIPVTTATRDTLNELARERNTPLNHLIVNCDPLVMQILRDDLAARTLHNATRYT